ncbi:hypothetical protein KAH27_03545 [bacterium]|nr:hypothetical protein [bacterium]
MTMIKCNKIILIISIVSIISIFQSLNIVATTNKVALDYQKKIKKFKKTYASQWDVLTKNADELATSIKNATKKQKILDKLLKRINDKTDPLDNLQEYEPVICDSISAQLVYDNAYDMIKSGDINRSFNLFSFLISDKNPNGFTVGSSYYFRGVILEELYHNTEAAFDAYLQVHAYPACLVYTDDSYIRAARISRFRKKRDTALALYSIRVPQIDYYKNEFRKIFASIDIARERNDLTNRVRQVMRANELSQCKPKYEKLADSVYKDLCGRTSTNKIAAISADLAKTESFDQYTMKTIIKALTGPDAATNNPALEDMLLHDWPLMDNVAEMHPEILTNRVLSNNIFEQKRRKDILKQYKF